MRVNSGVYNKNRDFLEIIDAIKNYEQWEIF